MPVYNGEDYLPLALGSIVKQSDEDIECIIVDGGSIDSTLSIVGSFQDKLTIRLFHREKESNWVSKTNHALSVASGEYACFLHHDDIWLDGRLKEIKLLLRQFPNAAMILHPSYFIDALGNNLGLWRCPLPASPQIIKPEYMVKQLLIQNFISILGPVFKRDLALKVGGLDESFWYTADWDFWLKIAACGNTIYHPKPLSGYRIHPNAQTVVRSSQAQDFRNQLETVLHRHMRAWSEPAKQKIKLEKMTKFSIEVNTTLAGVVHRNNSDYLHLLISFFLLGPRGAFRYLYTSRILERVAARLRAQLIIRRRKNSTAV